MLRPRFLTFSITTKIHALENSLQYARQCITCLNVLLKRLYTLEKTEWLEQALVTRVYITGKYPQTQGLDGIKDLRRILDGTLQFIFINSVQKSRKIRYRHYQIRRSAQCKWFISQRLSAHISYSGKYPTHSSQNNNLKMLFLGVY